MYNRRLISYNLLSQATTFHHTLQRKSQHFEEVTERFLNVDLRICYVFANFITDHLWLQRIRENT